MGTKGSRKSKMDAQTQAKAPKAAKVTKTVLKPGFLPPPPKPAKTVKGAPVEPKVGRGRPKMTKPDGTPESCFVRGCGKDYRSKGYCSAHYQFARSHGWPLPPPERNWTPEVKA